MAVEDSRERAKVVAESLGKELIGVQAVKRESSNKKGYNSSLKESLEKLPKQISYDFAPSYYDTKLKIRQLSMLCCLGLKSTDNTK